MAHHHSTTALRTKQQNARLHLLTGRLDIDTEQRHDLVHSFTNGRTSSSREMTEAECNSLIHALEKQLADADGEKLYRMRRKAFSLAHELGWEDAQGKVDRTRLDGWCVNKSSAKKPLLHMTVAELRNLLTQLEQVLAKAQRNG
ncbi:MAG TPA: hypothetical protein PL070_08645 [Flavobacteriales bacterium]|nr:hypothetical protein [Flavobacteriales bacterium]